MSMINNADDLRWSIRRHRGNAWRTARSCAATWELLRITWVGSAGCCSIGSVLMVLTLANTLLAGVPPVGVAVCEPPITDPVRQVRANALLRVERQLPLARRSRRCQHMRTTHYHACRRGNVILYARSSRWRASNAGLMLGGEDVLGLISNGSFLNCRSRSVSRTTPSTATVKGQSLSTQAR